MASLESANGYGAGVCGVGGVGGECVGVPPLPPPPPLLLAEEGDKSIPFVGRTEEEDDEDFDPLDANESYIRERFDSIRKVGRITAPVMFAHSVEDALVPHRHGRMLHEKVTAPKRFLDLRGDHNTGFAVSMGDYLPFWADFLRDVLPE